MSMKGFFKWFRKYFWITYTPRQREPVWQEPVRRAPVQQTVVPPATAQRGNRLTINTEPQAERVSYSLTLHYGKEDETFALVFQGSQKVTSSWDGVDGLQYTCNGRDYTDTQSLWAEKVEALSNRVSIGKDVHGENVLKLYTEIPTFDSSDREWDSYILEFLFFDGKEFHLVVTRGGYRIATLTFYNRLLSASHGMKSYFEKLGWPTDRIKWK